MVTMVRRLALKEHADALVQLASPITAAMKFGVCAGDNPFAKVKKLITDLISRIRQKPATKLFALMSWRKPLCRKRTSKPRK